MPRIPRPVIIRPVQQIPIRLVFTRLDHHTAAVRLRNRTTERIRVQIADRGGARPDRPRVLGHQAARQVHIADPLGAWLIALLQAIESDDPTALVGLPLIRTCRLLREAGIDPLAT